MPTSRRTGDEDRFGFDENRDYIAEFLSAVVPDRLAHRAVTIEVSTDRREYALDAPVEFTVTIRNRLPVPVTLPTPTLRLWGWTIDGELEASDEATFVSESESWHAFDARETRRIQQTWHGRFERSGAGPSGRTKWVLPDPGVHELSVFLATDEPQARDTVELELR